MLDFWDARGAFEAANDPSKNKEKETPVEATVAMASSTLRSLWGPAPTSPSAVPPPVPAAAPGAADDDAAGMGPTVTNI